MEKFEIIKRLQAADQTILSFPDRGNDWGNNRYRGNCSGWIQAFLIWKYRVSKFGELFAGGGTGSDVARDMNVPYIGADLNPTPVRNNILVTNAVTDAVPDEFLDCDMVFMHPPYGKEINIPYAGNMYPDPTGTLSKSDLGQMPWNEFMETLNKVVMKYYAAMKNHSRMAILMGDVRRNGQFHSMLADIVKPGNLEQIIVKQQHNVMSSGTSYANRNFVPMNHEFLMVIAKNIANYMINYQIPVNKEIDIRDSQDATWDDVIYTVMTGKGELSLNYIYGEVDGHVKCQNNSHWQEKIRQTLQIKDRYRSLRTGYWLCVA